MFPASRSLKWLLLAAVFGIAPAWAARLALVIGNDKYQSVGKLRNAGADAETMAVAFRKAGYQVVLKRDLELKAFKDELRAFRRRVQGGDEVVLYFSGHGVQFGGDNYLLPVDVRSESEDQVRDDAVALSAVLADLRSARAAFTLAVIDACRDNPFPPANGRAIGGRGLARADSATGQMVLYAAGEGQQALDRLGANDPVANGLFTRVFVKQMEKPGVPVDQVLRNVRVEVNRLALSVKHEQVPALYDQVLGTFYFYPPGASVPAAAAAAAPAEPAGVSLADLEKEEAQRRQTAQAAQSAQSAQAAQWAAWQQRMREDFDRTAGFNGSPDLQTRAWERFLAAWAQDNPASRDDDELRAEALRRLQVLRQAAAPGRVEAANSSAIDPGRDAKDTVLMDFAINYSFTAWSSAWQVDRYTAGSAHVAEKDCDAVACKVRGSFTFARFGASRTIPFSATLERKSSPGFNVTRLCYDDPSSGMRDCIGAQR